MRCSMNQWENGNCQTILITAVQKHSGGAVNVRLVSKRGIGCRDVRRRRQGLEQKAGTAMAVNPFLIWKPKSHADFSRLWFWFKKRGGLDFHFGYFFYISFLQAPLMSSPRGPPPCTPYPHPCPLFVPLSFPLLHTLSLCWFSCDPKPQTYKAVRVARAACSRAAVRTPLRSSADGLHAAHSDAAPTRHYSTQTNRSLQVVFSF